MIALALSFGVVILLLIIWSIRRHRDPHLHIECGAPIEELMPSLAGLTLATAVDGNTVEIFENGAYFEVLLAEIRSAKRSVHFETFLWAEGMLGQRVADALSERSRAGLQVRVLLDATGTKKMGQAADRQMTQAGCKVVKYHRRHIRNIGVMNERDHRKLVVLDGRVALLGGHCIVDAWLGDAQDKEHFADISVRVRGPIVNAVQSAFSENWAGETGELFAGDDAFPALEKSGDVTAHAAYLKPEGSAPAVKILHHTIICLARKRIWIQNPYFIPEPEAIDAFGAAVKRGVDVRVMMPSTGGSDNPMVQHAGHRNFEKLLRCGVRLFEYSHTLLHQKVMTVDGVWCSIGSTNFDDRSFETNDADYARIQGHRSREAARGDFREVRSPLYRDQAGGVAQAPAVASPDRQHVLLDQRSALVSLSGRRRRHRRSPFHARAGMPSGDRAHHGSPRAARRTGARCP